MVEDVKKPEKIPIVKWMAILIVQCVWLFIIGPIMLSAPDSFMNWVWVIGTLMGESVFISYYINRKN